MANIMGNITNFANRLGNTLGEVQYKNIGADNPALFRKLEDERVLGNLRQQELEMRQQQRADEIKRQKMFGNLMQTPAGQKFAKKLGLPPEFAPAIQDLGDLQILGKLAAPQDMGATGALVKRVMQDNPDMSFTDALAQVQTGFRRGVRFTPQGAVPIEGFGAALGNIGGQEEYGTRKGEFAARLEDEPTLVEEKAAAEVTGAGEITPQQQMQIDKDKAKLAGKYALLTEKENLKNINTVGQRLLEDADMWTTGFLGKAGSYIAGTPQSDFAADLQTVLSDSTLNRLVELKDSSDTGASGLGQVTEKEIDLLMASRAALIQSQSPEQFARNLKRYLDLRNKMVSRVALEYKERFGELPEGFEETEQTDVVLPNEVKNVFNTLEEAEAANLPVGSVVTVQGKKYRVE